MTKRVYLAGPDVFFKDSAARADELKRLCVAEGLVGLFPLDVPLKLDKLPGPERARIIFETNVGLIRSCQGVLANMTPFRGPSADVGTAWEMGFAYGLGLPVVGYTLDGRRYAARVTPDEHDIEDFDLVDNLMLGIGVAGCATTLVDVGGGTAMRFAVQKLAAILRGVHG
jgi:nucleoside 2-deoxyribosyltransferase